MKTTRFHNGLVLQRYSDTERFRDAADQRAVTQLKRPALRTPNAPRPDLLPPQMRRGALQAKPDREPGGGRSETPRPELPPAALCPFCAARGRDGALVHDAARRGAVVQQHRLEASTNDSLQEFLRAAQKTNLGGLVAEIAKQKGGIEALHTELTRRLQVSIEGQKAAQRSASAQPKLRRAVDVVQRLVDPSDHRYLLPDPPPGGDGRGDDRFDAFRLLFGELDLLDDVSRMYVLIGLIGLIFAIYLRR